MYGKTLAGPQQQGLDLGTEPLAGVDESARIAAALFGERPEMAGNRASRLGLLDEPGGVNVAHVAEHAVDAGQDEPDPTTTVAPNLRARRPRQFLQQDDSYRAPGFNIGMPKQLNFRDRCQG